MTAHLGTGVDLWTAYLCAKFGCPGLNKDPEDKWRSKFSTPTGRADRLKLTASRDGHATAKQ